MSTEPISRLGYEKLEKEIQFFKEVEIPNIIEDIKISASYGDLTENSEYEAAKERQEFLMIRMSELEHLLSTLIIIDPSKSDHTKITFGTTFEIINADTSKKNIYTIVGGYEADPSKGTISYNSPLAKYFRGKELGEEVIVKLNNKETYYEIEKVYFDENRL